MAKSKLPKGSREQLVATQPRENGQYCLYNLTGLSLGKVLTIKRLLETAWKHHPEEVLAAEIYNSMGLLVIGKEVKPFHTTVDPIGHPTPADFE